MNYASTSNIQEVIKFYNLGEKTFETEFNAVRKFINLLIIVHPTKNHLIVTFCLYIGGKAQLEMGILSAIMQYEKNVH